MKLSVESVDKLFLDVFIYNDKYNFTPEPLRDFMNLVAKDGTIDCPAETLGSIIKEAMEIKH